MIEKNLKICNKFFNKLLIKIEDLKNNFTLLLKVDKIIFKNIINQKDKTFFIQSIDIRDMFINKLFSKIEDLENDFTLLLKVDKIIFKNKIYQKGGSNIVNNINIFFLYIIQIKKYILNYNNEIKKLNKIDTKINNYIKKINDFLNALINSFYKKPKYIDEINKEDAIKLNELMETDNLTEFLNNPKNKTLLKKIEPVIFNKFFELPEPLQLPSLLLQSPKPLPPSLLLQSPKPLPPPQ